MARGTPVAALEPGDPEQIGPFRLVGRIGAGGMGRVYLAQGANGRPAAIKVIRAELTQDPVIRQRFFREVHAARQVRSPVTAAVLDADPEASPPWVAFEYIDSPNLEEVVEDQLPRLSAAVGILSGIAEALMAIHQAGIIHRDLKPSNILCPPNGVKVIDFGIAAARESTGLTASGLIGTPAWLSPEQILGQPLTPAVDVFAWGCVAVYTLTGRMPFAQPGDIPAAIFYRIVNGDVDLSGIPPQLLDPVSRALAKDPAARPAVPALLDMVLPGRPQAATPPPPTPTGPPQPPPSSPTVRAGPSPPPPGPPPAPSPAQPGRRRALAIAVAVVVLVALGVGVYLARKPNTNLTTSTTTTVTTPSSTSPQTTAPAPTTTAPGTLPTTLAGFTMHGSPVTTTVRVFQGEGGSLVTNFPFTMNGCDLQAFTVAWRALGPAVTAGMTSDQQVQGPVPLTDVPHPVTAVAGSIEGDGCSQPAFFFVNAPPDTLEDVAVEYQVWVPTP